MDDYTNIERLYVESFLTPTPKNKIVKRLSPTTVEVDGKTKDIWDWILEANNYNLERPFIAYTIRRRDKTEGRKRDGTFRILARAGDVLEMDCKLGRCPNDPEAKGDYNKFTALDPEQKYDKYGLLVVCADRGGAERETRSLNIFDVFKFKINNVIYDVI